jgi:hypothetical protein
MALTVAEAAAAVATVVGEMIIARGENIVAAMGRIGELQFDPNTEAEIVGELSDLKKSLAYRLRDETAALSRLSKGLGQYEHKLRGRRT